MLSTICETSDLVGIFKENEMHGNVKDAYKDSGEDLSSVSETFIYLNKPDIHSNSHACSSRRSEKANAIDDHHKVRRKVPTVPARQHPDDTLSENTLQDYLVSFTIDVVPCLIAAIWAIAIFLSMPGQSR